MAERTEVEHVETAPDGTVERTRNRPTFAPMVDIIERSEDYLILADLPGIEESTIVVTLEKNVLSLEASRVETAPEGFGLALEEYAGGDFYRAFRIGREVDRERIEATYDQGVLRLSLPKAAPARSLKIAVKSGSQT